MSTFDCGAKIESVTELPFSVLQPEGDFQMFRLVQNNEARRVRGSGFFQCFSILPTKHPLL